METKTSGGKFSNRFLIFVIELLIDTVKKTSTIWGCIQVALCTLVLPMKLMTKCTNKLGVTLIQAVINMFAK